jgi:hypothetical protein
MIRDGSDKTGSAQSLMREGSDKTGSARRNTSDTAQERECTVRVCQFGPLIDIRCNLFFFVSVAATVRNGDNDAINGGDA